MVKPLKDLLAEADRILGQTKEASAAVSDEVSSLADTLLFANTLEEQFVQEEISAQTDEEFEKVAKAVNKIAAEIEWDVLTKADQFEEAALAQGYTQEQVAEAMSKIAASKIKQHLDSMASGAGSLHGKDDNSLETKKVKSLPSEKNTRSAVQALRG